MRVSVFRALYRHLVWARWFYALLASAIIFYLSSKPVRIPGNIPHLDKAFHFVTYFGLCLAYFNVATRGGKRTTLGACLLAGVLAVVYGLTDEWHQSYVPGRSADWQDLVADSVGAGSALLLGWVLRRRSAQWDPQPAQQAGPYSFWK